ncbi:MAG: amino acid permease [Kiritimatiellaeota bacterium]|nr:amino acid permease [Kiritimatiellota bacterium]
MGSDAGQAGGPQIATELSRDLNLFHVTMMGVGMMIGAGVFLGIAECVGVVGPGGALLTFALNGVIAMCSAMSYAELCSAVPRAGGAYNFARIGFGRGTSFFAGWMEWFASTVAGSMYSLVFAIYVLNYLDGLGLLWWEHFDTHFSVKVLAVIVALIFVYINYRGASETGKAGALFALGQTITLALIGGVGLWVVIRDPGRIQNFRPFLPNGWLRILATMGFTYVAFEGFEVIAQAGDETIEPRRNLPKAMLLSVVIVAVTYVAVTFAAIVAVSRADIAGLEGVVSISGWFRFYGTVGFAKSVQLLLSSGFGSLLVALAVIFSSTSALNATIYSATRAVYALGRDHFLPPAIAHVSPKTKTPVVALVVTAAVAVSIAVFTPTKHVMSFASIMFLFLFLLVNLCAIRIRRHMGDEMQYGYLMPFFPLPPLIGIAAQVFLAMELRHMSWVAWIVAPSWLGLGLAVYWLYGRSHVTQTRDEIVVFRETPPPSTRPCRILAPVANPDNALRMLLPILRIAEKQDAQVELLHLVPIPEQIPLSDAGQFMGAGEEAIVEAMLYLGNRFPISHTVRYCRNSARGILSAAREHRADFIIMGWRGRSARRDFFFGSTVDPVLERNPCNVIVLKNCTKRSYRRVLAPFAGGPHSILALNTAAMLAADDGVIVPFHVTAPGRRTVDVSEFLERHRDRLLVGPGRFTPKYSVSSDLLGALRDEAAGYDLVVIGAGGGGNWRRLASGALPEMLAEQIDSAVVMVKARTRVKSLLNRWI